MTASEILKAIVTRFPTLLPWNDETAFEKDHFGCYEQLRILVGSWDEVDMHVPPPCGHPTCRQNWVDTGGHACVAEPCDECGGDGNVIVPLRVSAEMAMAAGDSDMEGQITREAVRCRACDGAGIR